MYLNAYGSKPSSATKSPDPRNPHIKNSMCQVLCLKAGIPVNLIDSASCMTGALCVLIRRCHDKYRQQGRSFKRSEGWWKHKIVVELIYNNVGQAFRFLRQKTINQSETIRQKNLQLLNYYGVNDRLKALQHKYDCLQAEAGLRKACRGISYAKLPGAVPYSRSSRYRVYHSYVRKAKLLLQAIHVPGMGVQSLTVRHPSGKVKEYRVQEDHQLVPGEPIVTENDIDMVDMILRLKDKSLLSNEGCHELSMVCKGLARSHSVKSRLRELNNVFETEVIRKNGETIGVR